MNTKQKLESIKIQLEDLKKERSVLGAIDVFEQVNAFNLKFDMDSSEITIDQERKEPWISLIVTKNKKEVENFFINVVLKDYELEPISDTSLAYFIEALDVNNKKSITINKHTTLDEFMNTYINHEYNSLYLYKKMTPDFEKMMKKRV